MAYAPFLFLTSNGPEIPDSILKEAQEVTMWKCDWEWIMSPQQKVTLEKGI